ncbi:unnamed protein product, partial [Nesidiocoris tenuis]
MSFGRKLTHLSTARYNAAAQPDQQIRQISERRPQRRLSSGAVQSVNQPQTNQVWRTSDAQGPPPSYPDVAYAPYCQTTVVQQQQILLPTSLQPLAEISRLLGQNNVQNQSPPQQQNFGMNQYQENGNPPQQNF